MTDSSSPASCPACGSGDLDVFHEESGMPTNSCLLLDTQAEAASFPTGDLRLGFCRRCGFITNLAFDPAMTEYSGRYEETQAYSPVFVDFARSLAKRWVSDHDLVGSEVVEIGCGKGEFLVMMAEAGIRHGTGIDPGVKVDRIPPGVADRLTWVADFYSEEHAELEADAVVCRHTLEHISDVGRFMELVRANVRDDAVVLFELPDTQRVLDEVAFWDVYFEHCSYFSIGSLVRLFRATGFEVLDASLAYDDQYLLLEARPSTSPTDLHRPIPGEDDLAALAAGVERFRTGYARTRAAWRRKLGDVAASGGTSVIWGAGSKGVSFLTSLGVGDEVAYAVDINPHKADKYIAGTGHRIVGPDHLRRHPPDEVIVMNPIYVEEITATLADMGLTPNVSAV